MRSIFLVKDIFHPSVSILKFRLAVLVSLQLADVPVVAVGSKRFVGINLHQFLVDSDHLSRQGAVFDADVTAYGRSLYILNGEIDGVGIFTWNIILYLLVVTDGYICKRLLFIHLASRVIYIEFLYLYILVSLWLVIGIGRIQCAGFHLYIIIILIFFKEFLSMRIDRRIVGITHVSLVGRSLDNQGSQTLFGKVILEVICFSIIRIVNLVNQLE